jgi:hypothetical protein
MKIESYKFGQVTIDGEVYRKDVIIRKGDVIRGWRRKEGHSLDIEDLKAILDDRPEVLIIGQGAYGRMVVPDKTISQLKKIGIEVIPLVTAEACEEFNRLSENRNVFAALHLTC